MAKWFVQYCPGSEDEPPCFRIAAEDDPACWIAQTNPGLPLEAQEETALLIADALSRILGI
ncbi:MAG TPA: hypothetical protein VK752_06000 [Bryobacteraceae bacterium]|jgi:hypothetical protein|nr:hypothetical protein [Bryobacteraceae bacterium]